MPSDEVRTEEPKSLQSVLTDNFFYFFLKLRKNRVQKVVAAINERFPEETLEQRARRLIAAQTPLSFIGGALAELPMIIPGLGQALGLLGLFGGGLGPYPYAPVSHPGDCAFVRQGYRR
jgi:hypothetical protein